MSPLPLAPRRGVPDDIRAGTFHEDQVTELLNQKGCAGLRSVRLTGNLRLFMLAREIKASLEIPPFLAIAWGVRCPKAA